MRSTDDFQNIMRTYLAIDLSGKNFVKIRSVVIKTLGELYIYP